MTGTRRDQVTATVRGSGLIAIAIGVMNVTTYGFTIIAARVLGPSTYGAVAGLMATLMVISVLQLGIQATAARRVASDPDHRVEIERAVMAVTYRIALALGALLLLASPLLVVLLRLDGLPPALLVAAAAVPLTITGGQAGVLQGERRWAALSLIYLSLGVGRLLLGAGLILARPTELMAMTGVAAGLGLSATLGAVVLRGPREQRAAVEMHRPRVILRESLHNGFALLAFFALSNADIIVARNLFSARDAGLYAAGLILSKAVLFLPQFVVVIAFPTLSGTTGRRRALALSLALVATLGALATGVTWLFPQLALVFVGGSAFAAIQDQLWLFALIGTALSMLQLLLFSELARQGRRATWFLGGALVVMVGVALLAVDTVGGLVLLVVLIDTGLGVLLVGAALRRREPVGG